MLIETIRNIGDHLVINGKDHEIISIHLYESKDKHTERYYLGNGTWFTQTFDKNGKEQVM